LKVIIVTSTAPFVHGGANLLVDWLEAALCSRGHEVDTFRIPVDTRPDRLPGQLLGLRLWDFTGYGDRLIAVRTPSYLVRHQSKVVWFLHHHRPSYDLWDSYPDVPDDGTGDEFRRMMFVSDELALGESEALFTNSQRVSGRLREFNGLDSEVLYPPLGESQAPRPGPFSDTLAYVSRITSQKRQILAIEALACTQTPVRLAIAGADGGSGESERIRSAIVRLGLEERVDFYDEVISEDRKNELFARSLGVVYIPEDEDSYGFVGLEAAGARKPVVTTTDSGGVHELVTDQVNGLVTRPDPEALAVAFDALWSDRGWAEALGAAHMDQVAKLNISWDHVVERLLA
jgi:glycosyltransferase involved in cell wall biosynthesis